ncbi:hypothetical protein [Ruminococcus sp.]|uniref:hypothetical protein n=1 Tax=Ruminococcus sp. TaxID=41978 RepID=UPI003996070C
MAQVFCIEDDNGMELICCALRSGGYTVKDFPTERNFPLPPGNTAGSGSAGHYAAG